MHTDAMRKNLSKCFGENSKYYSASVIIDLDIGALYCRG